MNDIAISMYSTEAQEAMQMLGAAPESAVEKLEPKLEDSIKFKNTFEITLILTQEGPGDQERPLLEEKDAKFLEEFGDAKTSVRKIGVSPNRVPFNCPNEWCRLRWVHRVGIDDFRFTPNYCAYCARAYDTQIRPDQVSLCERAVALQDELKDLQDSLEGLRPSQSDKKADVENRIEIINDQLEKCGEEARSIQREVPLVPGAPYGEDSE